MSLVSNFIGGISFPQITNPGINNIDLSDTTFSTLLEKQMEINSKDNSSNMINSLGIPAGLQIEDYNPSVEAQNNIEANISNDLKNDEYTTSETVTFFNSLLDNDIENQSSHSEVFDFARKQAANYYNKYARNVIVDVQEFAEDLKQFISK